GELDLTYDVSDGTTSTSTGGTITVTEVNDAPDIVEETNFTLEEDGSITITEEQLLENASDIDGDELSVENLNINGGELTDNGDGTWTFEPDDNFNGELDLTYDVSDGTTSTSTGGTITVTEVNDAPDISEETNFTLEEDGSILITEEQLLENASDIDGDELSVENLNING
ncbi:MAG: tandem-95 repeat protein, partial [Colwellia sp.]|nr:tandem-95 repeat protein [Colwellia sp.]